MTTPLHYRLVYESPRAACGLTLGPKDASTGNPVSFVLEAQGGTPVCPACEAHLDQLMFAPATEKP